MSRNKFGPSLVQIVPGVMILSVQKMGWSFLAP